MSDMVKKYEESQEMQNKVVEDLPTLDEALILDRLKDSFRKGKLTETLVHFARKYESGSEILPFIEEL